MTPHSLTGHMGHDTESTKQGLRLENFILRYSHFKHNVYGIGTAPVCDPGTTGSIAARFHAVP